MEKTKDVGELPDNHLMMPPPYWRASNALFQILETLDEINILLGELPAVHKNADLNTKSDYLFELSEKDKFYEIANITGDLFLLEYKLSLKCELVVFLIAIVLEDKLNMTIVYNLDKDLSELSEKMNLSEKLQLISIVLKNKSVKSDKIYQKVRAITKWRNAYAHGHCTDRPTNSLRHNHLIFPDVFLSLPGEIKQLKEYLQNYIEITCYLRDISINDYTKNAFVEDKEIKKTLILINKLKFTNKGNDAVSYGITLNQ